MSADIVDDLHAAEDAAATLAGALRTVAAATANREVRDAATKAADDWSVYCRPTCGYAADGECVTGETLCGCPCDHPKEMS